MLQQLIPFLPNLQTRVEAWAFIATAALGLVLWVVGGRYTQPLMALIGVFCGGIIGRQIPSWLGWSIDTMTPTVALAILIGISGFVFHRAWAAIALGGIFALWAFFGTWIVLHGNNQWSWPASTFSQFGPAVWNSLPPEVARILPFTSGAAFLTGMAPMILWPRIATALLYSCVGLTVTVLCGLVSTPFALRHSIANSTLSLELQSAILASLVIMGSIIQCRLTPKSIDADTKSQEPDESDEFDERAPIEKPREKNAA
jgi:hypothetical protein